MKMVLKSQIPGWKSLSKGEKRRIMNAVEKGPERFSLFFKGIIFCVILGLLTGLIGRGLRSIGANGALFYGLRVFSIILVTVCVQFLYLTIIVNPRILREIENNKEN